MRLVYVLIVYLLAPVVIAMEAWKALWNPEYRGRLGQRLGLEGPVPPGPSLWVHGVSVGEVQAAAALVRELRRSFPGLPVVVTTVTPTGAQRARALFDDTVSHCYLPYDLPGSVRRFLDRTQPRVAIIMETEIWPTLYHALGRRGIPLVMASARVSTRSVDRYRRMASLFRETLSHGILIGAQTAADAERFRIIGAAPDRVRVTGNVKFDMEIPAAAIENGRAFRASVAAARPVWIAGSTHEGEEDIVLAAHARVRERHPDALLILVPRHPQRFEAVRALLPRGTESSWWTRSANCRCSTPPRTSRSSPAASCRSAGTACSSPPCSACRCCRGRTTTTRRTWRTCSSTAGRCASCAARKTSRRRPATGSPTPRAPGQTASGAGRPSRRAAAR